MFALWGCKSLEGELSKLLGSNKDSGITESLIIEVNFIVSTSNSWCVDSGATNHICNTLQRLQKTKKLGDSEVTLHLHSETSYSVCKSSKISISFK